MDFNNIYMAWEQARQNHNFNTATYTGRNDLFRAWLDANPEVAIERIQGFPPVENYFESNASSQQRLRDMIEQRYFELHRDQSVMARCKQVMLEKKHEEVQAHINNILQEDNYQRWLQVRYQCQIEEARQRALRDFMAQYQAEHADKQPKQNQGPMFPRFEQVIQNSLYDSKSYAQGWVGYTAAAVMISVGECLGTILKESNKLAVKQEKSLDIIEELYEMEQGQEDEALSYILLTLKNQDRYMSLFSAEEKAHLEGVIQRRSERLPETLISSAPGVLPQALQDYEQNNPEYQQWVTEKLDGLHLHCQSHALDSALNFYKEVFYTNVYMQNAQSLLNRQPLPIMVNQQNKLALMFDQEIAEPGQPQDNPLDSDLFMNNTVDRLSHFIQHAHCTAQDDNIFIDESNAVKVAAPGHRLVPQFKGLEREDELFHIAQTAANTGFFQAVLTHGKALLLSGCSSMYQRFIALQHKYLAGESQQTNGMDGMSNELKSHISQRRKPRHMQTQ